MAVRTTALIAAPMPTPKPINVVHGLQCVKRCSIQPASSVQPTIATAISIPTEAAEVTRNHDQGAVAVECRAEDPEPHALFAALDDAATRVCVEAERAMNRALHGSCHVPVAAFAQSDGDELVLSGLVGSAADGRVLRTEARGPATDPDALGRRVAAQLLEQGAGAFLA